MGITGKNASVMPLPNVISEALTAEEFNNSLNLI
jgi:hypothetical protein